MSTGCGYNIHRLNVFVPPYPTKDIRGGHSPPPDGHVKWLRPEEMGKVECANGPPAPFKD